MVALLLCRYFRHTREAHVHDLDQGPDDTRNLVGKCDPHQHWRLTRQHPAQPSAGLGRSIDMSLADNAVGTDDQYPSQGSLAHSGRGPEPLLSTGRMLSWHQTKPGRKIAGLAEGLGGRGKNRDGRGDQWTNAAPGISSLFTGTKRIVGRTAASQIASASAASFF